MDFGAVGTAFDSSWRCCISLTPEYVAHHILDLHYNTVINEIFY